MLEGERALKGKAVSGMMLTLLLVGMLTLTLNIQPVKASGTIYIRADGSVDPPGVPISSVDNITYIFTADIYDSIVVERDNIVVDGAGYTLEGPAAAWGMYLSGRQNVTIRNIEIKLFTNGIYLSTSRDNTIHGNNITNNNEDGIYMETDSYGHNNISGNSITNNGNGIRLGGAYDNTIYGNNITTNSDDGIYVFMSSNNNIVGNNIRNNSGGIYVYEESGSNTVSGNNITENNDGIRLVRYSNDNTFCGNNITNNNGDGIYMGVGSHGSNISGNSITNNKKNGIYLVEGSGSNTISGNNITENEGGGIHAVWASGNNTIHGNNITNNNEDGIYMETDSYGHNNISGNSIRNNSRGIYLVEGSGSNTISGNNITNNGDGIFAMDSSGGNTISGNNIRNNSRGISLEESSIGSIHSNNFIDNTEHVHIYTSGYTNLWDDGYPSCGNFWSNYTDTDQYRGPDQNETGSDGVWDHPYFIDPDNEDRYPLVNPSSPPRWDVAVFNVTPSKNIVSQNEKLNINVTVANQGSLMETFNVTLYAEAKCVGYWKFDEGKGTTAQDSSGNNNNGTISGAAWTSGRIGNALQFDGTDDYVEVPSSASLNLTNTGTITAWIRIPSVGAVNRGDIVSKGGGWNRRGWMLTTVEYNRIRFHWQSLADTFIDSQTTLTYDEWHHIAAVMDGTVMKIYIDGIQDPNTLLNTESADTTNIVRIGRTDYYGNLPFKGMIDEVQVYNTALRKEQISALATTGRFTIQIQTITLASGNFTTLTFTWNTTGVPYGDYTIGAYATSSPYETDTDDNTFINGVVEVIEIAMPVGGISIPVNKLSLLAPYIGLTILLAVAVITVVYVRKRKRHTD